MTAPVEKSPVSLSLYALGEQYQTIIDAISEAGGEITEAQILELAAVEDRFEVKAEKVTLFIRNLEAMVGAGKEEIRRLASLNDTRTKTADSLKKYLFEQMQATGKLTIDRPLAKLSIVNNGGVLPVSWNGPPVECPAPYRTETLSYGVDRAKVLADHEAGKVLPVGLSVGERGKRLSIK